MEPLQATVLFGVSGLDAFGDDPQLDPPRRQRREAAEADTCKRWTVVCADDPWQAVLPEGKARKEISRGRTITTATELKDQILSKAAEDNDFRARLIADPKAAISAETGASIPEGFDFVVHEDSATTAHLVLPPSPQLTEAELAQVSGGAVWGGQNLGIGHDN